MKRRWLDWIMGIMAFGVVGCGTINMSAVETRIAEEIELIPTLENNVTVTETAEPPYWTEIAPGLERRWEKIEENGRQVNTLYLLRIDPKYYQFGVDYAPGEPKPLSVWQRETDALVVVNGGYFTPEQYATGLTIVDGEQSGWSYNFGGMVDIRDGVARVRSLEDEPYQDGERIDFGLQAFPMLVRPGDIGYDGGSVSAARRTVIGQDKEGYIIILVADSPSFTLHGLSKYLLTSSLNLDVALNLDGGSSSGVQVALPREGLSGFVALPTVITVKAR